MRAVVHCALALACAVVQAVAPWACCCGGPRMAASTTDSFSPKKCCHLPSSVCGIDRPSPAAPARPATPTPCDFCALLNPPDPVPPGPAVVPDFSDESFVVDWIDAWSADAGEVWADVPNSIPERQSPRH